MAAYATVMSDYAGANRGALVSAGQSHGVDMAQEMMRLTLAIVGKTLFDADIANEASEIGEALTKSLHAVNGLLLPGAYGKTAAACQISTPRPHASGWMPDLPRDC